MEESAILELYDMFEQKKTNSQEYDVLLKRFNKVREKFDEKLDEQQRNELNTLLQLSKDMEIIEIKEYYKEGFSMATKLMTEAFYKDNT